MKNYSLGKIDISLDDDFMFYLPYMEAFSELGTQLNERIFNSSKGRPILVERLNNIDAQFADVITMYASAAIEVLLDNDIFDYDEKRFVSEFKQELSIKNTPEFQEFLLKYKKISDQEALAEIERKRRSDANGGYWIGGGFGIKGAIKGSIEASLLNTVYSAAVGIGNAIENKSEQWRLELEKEKLGQDDISFKAIFGVVRVVSINIPKCLFTIMEKRLGIKNNVILGEESEAATAIMNNIERVDDNKKLLLLKQALELDPRSVEILGFLLNHIDDLGLNRKKVYSFVSEVNSTFFNYYIKA